MDPDLSGLPGDLFRRYFLSVQIISDLCVDRKFCIRLSLVIHIFPVRGPGDFLAVAAIYGIPFRDLQVCQGRLVVDRFILIGILQPRTDRNILRLSVRVCEDINGLGFLHAFIISGADRFRHDRREFFFRSLIARGRLGSFHPGLGPGSTVYRSSGTVSTGGRPCDQNNCQCAGEQLLHHLTLHCLILFSFPIFLHSVYFLFSLMTLFVR